MRDLLERGEVSAAELLEATLAAIDRHDGDVRAWETLDPEGAGRASAESDERRRKGESRSALDGVPVGVKDLIDTAGLRTSYGSPLFADHVPERDAAVVAALREAGAVIVGKTVTTQFATFDPPVTRNPWNLVHTPGGSSSGSAAAVAAGMIPAAIGTQTGGSTIRPASYCGVVGLMPSPGWIGRSGIYPCAPSLDRLGLLAGSVEDAGLLLDACIGADAVDPVSHFPTRQQHEPGLPRSVAVLSGLVSAATDPTRAAVQGIARRLVDAGAAVTELELDDLEAAHEAHLTVMRVEIASVHADAYRDHADAYAPRISELIEAGSRVSRSEYEDALRFRADFRRSLAERTAAYDVLLAPASMGAAEADLGTIGSPYMNLLATFAGLPALALPAAVDPAGMPLGVQLIGHPDDDDRLLAVAAALEEAVAFERPALPATKPVAPSPD
jgi:Asp-tRNA(Asn)/Glu-tRNA(Gln) amidotransferase A subunit family amidase